MVKLAFTSQRRSSQNALLYNCNIGTGPISKRRGSAPLESRKNLKADCLHTIQGLDISVKRIRITDEPCGRERTRFDFSMGAWGGMESFSGFARDNKSVKHSKERLFCSPRPRGPPPHPPPPTCCNEVPASDLQRKLLVLVCMLRAFGLWGPLRTLLFPRQRRGR